MTGFFTLLVLFLSAVELLHVQPVVPALGDRLDSAADAAPLAVGKEGRHSRGRMSPNRFDSLRISEKKSDAHPKRFPRESRDDSPRKRDQHSWDGYRHPRPYETNGYRSDRYTFKGAKDNSSYTRVSSFPDSPLFTVTDGSYWAYLVLLLALVLFAVGIVGNLALMCIVWHNFYLKNTWNSIFAGLAFWDFVVLFFCLPVVVFHELTLKRLLGDASCRLVPYLEVTSQGVATFSLCALSIDHFHIATSPGPFQPPKVEPCKSILAKLSVIWVGSMVLASPELLLWQLSQGVVGQPELPADAQQSQPGSSAGRSEVFLPDVCVRQPSVDLPENIYSLVLTYHEARMWWFFGCYLCLPLLFIMACDLVTRRVLGQQLLQKENRKKLRDRCSPSSITSSMAEKNHHIREQRLRSTVIALTIMYVTCSLPENICNITLAYISIPVSTDLPALALPALSLIGQFLLFARCSATPVLLLCVCRSLGQAFMDCCCCCCEECHSNRISSSSSSASTTITVTTPSTLSSPVSPSPCSISPSSLKEERIKIISGTEPAVCNDRANETSAAIGTPC